MEWSFSWCFFLLDPLFWDVTDPRGPTWTWGFEFCKLTVILNMAKSAKGRVSLKLCRNNLAKAADVFQIVLCTKALYGLRGQHVFITSIFLLLGCLRCISSARWRQFSIYPGSGDVAELLVCSHLWLLCWQTSWCVLGLPESIHHNRAILGMRFFMLN